MVISKSPPQRKKVLDTSGLVERTAAKGLGSGFLSVPEDAGLLGPCQTGLLSQGTAQERELHLTVTLTPEMGQNGKALGQKGKGACWVKSFHPRGQAGLDLIAPGPPHPLWVGGEPPSRSFTLCFARLVWGTGAEGTFITTLMPAH